MGCPDQHSLTRCASGNGRTGYSFCRQCSLMVRLTCSLTKNHLEKYADGFAYSKHKMKEAFRSGGPGVSKEVSCKAYSHKGSIYASSQERRCGSHRASSFISFLNSVLEKPPHIIMQMSSAEESRTNGSGGTLRSFFRVHRLSDREC